MKTDLKLFRENLKAIKAKGSPYVRAGRENYLKFLKVCMCTESFNQDGLTIEKVVSTVPQILMVILYCMN